MSVQRITYSTLQLPECTRLPSVGRHCYCSTQGCVYGYFTGTYNRIDSASGQLTGTCTRFSSMNGNLT